MTEKSKRVELEDIIRRRPTAPGDVLREEILAANELTQDQLAEAMKVSRYTINQLVNGRRAVTAEMALRLGKATRTTAKFWLNLQTAVDLYEASVELADALGEVRTVVPDREGLFESDGLS